MKDVNNERDNFLMRSELLLFTTLVLVSGALRSTQPKIVLFLLACDYRGAVAAGKLSRKFTRFAFHAVR